MKTEEVAVADIRVGDVIKADDSDVWLEVDEIGVLVPQRREGSRPGDSDEFYTGHYFRGPMVSEEGKGDRHLFNYRDDLLIVRRLLS